LFFILFVGFASEIIENPGSVGIGFDFGQSFLYKAVLVDYVSASFNTERGLSV